MSAEGKKPDPKAVWKLRDWEIPRNKTEMQSILGFANYYREFIPWHAKLVAPLHAITGIKATFALGTEQQLAFNEIKKALIDATALAHPVSEGEFVLDTDTSAVAISGILHQWQGPPGERCLRPIVHGSKKLTATQAKYGAPKLENYAAHHYIVKSHSYLCPRKFTLRVDNQALSWLITCSTDQAFIGRWMTALENTISVSNIDHERNIAMPTVCPNAPMIADEENDSLKNYHQLKSVGISYPRTITNGSPPHPGLISKDE